MARPPWWMRFWPKLGSGPPRTPPASWIPTRWSVNAESPFWPKIVPWTTSPRPGLTPANPSGSTFWIPQVTPTSAERWSGCFVWRMVPSSWWMPMKDRCPKPASSWRRLWGSVCVWWWSSTSAIARMPIPIGSSMKSLICWWRWGPTTRHSTSPCSMRRVGMDGPEIPPKTTSVVWFLC